MPRRCSRRREACDQCAHDLSTTAAVGVAVGGDQALVDGPGGLDLDVLIAAEESLEADALLVGEQVRAGRDESGHSAELGQTGQHRRG